MNAFLKSRITRTIWSSLALLIVLLTSATFVGAQDSRLNNQFLFEDGRFTYVLNTNTGETVNVAPATLPIDGRLTQPRWSIDGSRIVGVMQTWERQQTDGASGDIWIVSPSGQLLLDVSYCHSMEWDCTSPMLSPDNNLLTYIAWKSDFVAHLRLLNISTGEDREIPTVNAMAFWAPETKWLNDTHFQVQGFDGTNPTLAATMFDFSAMTSLPVVLIAPATNVVTPVGCNGETYAVSDTAITISRGNQTTTIEGWMAQGNPWRECHWGNPTLATPTPTATGTAMPAGTPIATQGTQVHVGGSTPTPTTTP